MLIYWYLGWWSLKKLIELSCLFLSLWPHCEGFGKERKGRKREKSCVSLFTAPRKFRYFLCKRDVSLWQQNSRYLFNSEGPINIKENINQLYPNVYINSATEAQSTFLSKCLQIIFKYYFFFKDFHGIVCFFLNIFRHCLLVPLWCLW